MRTKRNIEEMIRTQKSRVSTGQEMDKMVLDESFAAMDRVMQVKSAGAGINAGGKIMRNPITKLAAAAVIVAGVVFGLKVLMSDLARPAYALEQTLDACKKKQQAHFTFGKDDKLFKAAWVEYDTEGNLARVRVDRRLDVNSESNEIFVWQDGHTKFYNPVHKLVTYFDDEDYSARVLHFVNRYDPRQAVEYLQKMEQKGDVKIAIEQPSDRSKSIVVTINYEPNTFLLDSNYPPMREVMLTDQTTKLITAVELWGPGKDFGHQEDEWTLLGTYKYDRYDEPFEDEIFDLEKEISEDVNVIDWNELGKQVGLEFTEPNLTEEQMAVDTVRAFFEALIAKDYNEVSRLRGMPEKMRAEFIKGLEKTNLNVIEVISIGKPYPPARSWGVMTVPCTVAVEINGKRIEKKLENVYVHRVLGHPNRRTVFFNFDVLSVP
jgi:hypothetical protein